jgi:predicted aldo/keto reductase-like oxidoreductase
MDLKERSEIRNYNELMKYRQLGSKGPLVSILGFGGRCLIDPDESKKALIEAISYGVNLFETGPGYGNSELIIGDAIRGYRDKVYISTKCSLVDECGTPISQDDLIQNVEMSLKRLRVNKIDIFNAWNICNPEHFKAARKRFGFIDGVRKLMDEGIIDHFGFSSHDSPENIKMYIDSGEFESVILSYSIIDTTYEDVINYASRRGLGVIAMKPLYGGVVLLLSNVFANQNSDDLAITSLQFVLSLPSISSAISGMTKTSEVKNNIKSVNGIESLELTFRNNITERYRSSYFYNIKFCSGCRYCDSCPVEIPIPKLMMLYNVVKSSLVSGEKEFQQFARIQTVELNDFEKCLECGQCEEKCPENLNIIERLKELHKILSDYGGIDCEL